MQSNSMARIDKELVSVLSVKDKASAIIKLRYPFEIVKLRHQLKILRYYPFINSIGVECDYDDVVKLSVSHDVEFVSAEMRVSTLEEQGLFDVTAFEDNETVHTLKSQGLTGDGVRFAVIDTGVGNHLDLSVPKERICHFVDFVNGKELPYDDNGHGTFVTGVAVGNGVGNGKTFTGVAPRAEVLGIKAIGVNGESSTFRILDAMQWLFDNFKAYGVKVVCMSFGAEPLTRADPLKIGAEMLVRKGLTVVCAVGNNGENNLKSPAISREVIAVGAVDDEGIPAKFSSYGMYEGVKRPDIYAKGVKIRGLEVGGTYSYMSGTSVSAPMVAGACCLLHEKYRNLTPYQAKQIILSLSRSQGEIKILDI